MKYKNLFNVCGMVVTLAAFVSLATAITLNITVLFFVSIGVLFAGILLSSVVPAYITGRWQKMMLEHGVPARARLVNISFTGGRFGDARLDFVTDDEITTTAFVGRYEKDKFAIDAVYSIRYNPSQPDFCLIMDTVKESASAIGMASKEQPQPQQPQPEQVQPQQPQPQQAQPQQAQAEHPQPQQAEIKEEKDDAKEQQ